MLACGCLFSCSHYVYEIIFVSRECCVLFSEKKEFSISDFFRLLLWLFTTEFAAYSKPPSRDNYRKALYPRTQQHVGYNEGGSEISITRSWSHGRYKNGALTLSATLPNFRPCCRLCGVCVHNGWYIFKFDD